MPVDKKIVIEEMNRLWQIICQSLTKKQIKENEYSINLITKNLATIEAIANQTISKTDWWQYRDLHWDMINEIHSLIYKLDNDYLFNYGANLYNFKKNLCSLLINSYETKLNELADKFKELSISDQSRIQECEYEIWTVERTISDFNYFSNDVGLIDQNLLKNANNSHSRILAHLFQLKLCFLDQEMGIYSSERFWIYDYGEKKIKPN